MKTYSINDYLNGNYETQNQITRHTKLKMLILDILSLITSFLGFVFLQIEVNFPGSPKKFQFFSLPIISIKSPFMNTTKNLWNRINTRMEPMFRPPKPQ